MPDRAEGAQELLVKNASLRPWLHLVIGLLFFAFLAHSSLQLLDPNWQPVSFRMAFVRNWPPILRTALFFGTFSICSFLMLVAFRGLLGPYIARLSSSGVDLANGFGHTRLTWEDIASVSVDPDSLRFFTNKTRLFGPQVFNLSTTGISPGRSELLGAVAHFRPDLMPNFTPIQPTPPAEKKPPQPQLPISVDSRSWTG
jgi:hypothetical protein